MSGPGGVIDDAMDTTLSASPKLNGASSSMQSNKTGWDGKLRLDKNKKAVLANPEALTDPEYSDEDAPPVDEIEADEGGRFGRYSLSITYADQHMHTLDLLDNEDPEIEVPQL